MSKTKRRRRRSMTSPSKQKLQRWATSLHEASHAIAFSDLCRARVKALVFADNQGLCDVRFNLRFWDPFSIAVSTMIGDLAAEEYWSKSVPSFRPRQSARRPRYFHKVPPDAVYLDRAVQASKAECASGDADAPLDLQRVPDEAHRFLRQHSAEIFDLAFRLYRTGRACVPAR